MGKKFKFKPNTNMVPAPNVIELQPILIKTNNVVANLSIPLSHANKGYEPMVEFLRNHPIFKPLTVSPYALYPDLLGEFWYTCTYLKSKRVISGTILDGTHRIRISLESFTKAIHWPSLSHYVDPTDETTAKEILPRIGYEMSVTGGELQKSRLPNNWGFLFSTIVRSLSGKTDGRDQATNTEMRMLHALITGRNINFASFLFDDLVEKTTVEVRSPHVPFIRFLSLIFQKFLGKQRYDNLGLESMRAPILGEKMFYLPATRNSPRLTNSIWYFLNHPFLNHVESDEEEEEEESDENNDGNAFFQKNTSVTKRQGDAILFSWKEVNIERQTLNQCHVSTQSPTKPSSYFQQDDIVHLRTPLDTSQFQHSPKQTAPFSGIKQSEKEVSTSAPVENPLLQLLISEVISLRNLYKDFQTTTNTKLSTLSTQLNNLESEVKTQLNHLEAEVKTELNHLEAEVKSQLNHLEAQVKSQLNHLEAEIKTQLNHLDAEAKTKDSNLHKDFQTYQTTFNSKLSNLTTELQSVKHLSSKSTKQPPSSLTSTPQVASLLSNRITQFDHFEAGLTTIYSSISTLQTQPTPSPTLKHSQLSSEPQSQHTIIPLSPTQTFPIKTCTSKQCESSKSKIIFVTPPSTFVPSPPTIPSISSTFNTLNKEDVDLEGASKTAPPPGDDISRKVDKTQETTHDSFLKTRGTLKKIAKTKRASDGKSEGAFAKKAKTHTHSAKAAPPLSDD